MKKTICAAIVAAALAVSCGGEQGSTTVSVGNKSKIDSLSYSVGVNFASGVSQQMSNLPLDYDVVADALCESALGKLDITREDNVVILRDYFTNEFQARAEAVEAERNAADSTAIAGGADAVQVRAARAAMGPDASMFNDEQQRKDISYALGVDLGFNLKEGGFPIQTYWISEAIKDFISGNPKITEYEANAIITKYFNETLPAEKAAESAANLAKIEKEKGVIKTESGLLYRIEEAGEQGTNATDDRDAVNVNYTGKLVSTGEVFDTSRAADRTEDQIAMMTAQGMDVSADSPIEFPLNRVIPGWTEGMKLVGKGGRISLWIPAELAYGTRGAGQNIGPNEALYFDVEVIDVVPFTEEAAE